MAKTINATPVVSSAALPWGQNLAFYGSDDQRQTHADGKCHRHARFVDANHQQNTPNVEHAAARNGRPDRAARRAVEIFEKRHSRGAGAAQREREQ